MISTVNSVQSKMCQVDVHADSRYPVDRRQLRAAISSLVDRYGMSDQRVLVDVSIVGSRKIRALNKQYRHLDEPTDVLSFPLESDRPGPDGWLRLGDVVICYPRARTIALRMNCLIDKVAVELAEHGVKHLLGEHHE